MELLPACQEKRDPAFKTELNLGLALVFEYSNKSRLEMYEKTTSYSWFDKNNDFHRAEVIINSPIGAPSALDQDVLTVLMSMVVEQNTLGPKFNFTEIGRRLGMKKGNEKRVKEAINRLMDVKIKFKNSFYSLEKDEFSEHTAHLITSTEFRKRIEVNAQSSEFHSVTFDKKIGENLLRGYFGLLDRETYIALPQGGARRLYQILETRRKLSGDSFILPIDQLALQLGLTNPKKYKTYLKKYFSILADEYKGFEYILTKANKDTVVQVNFIKLPEAEEEKDHYWDLIQKWYSEEKLKKINIGEKTLTLMRTQEDFGEAVSFGDKTIPRIDLYIDVLLYQDTPIKNFIGLLKKCLKTKQIIFPKDYNFISERMKGKELEEAKKQAEIRQHQQEEENKREKENLLTLVNAKIESLKNFHKEKYDKLKSEAKVKIGEEESKGLMANLLIHREIMKIVEERILNGKEI